MLAIQVVDDLVNMLLERGIFPGPCTYLGAGVNHRGVIPAPELSADGL